MKAKNSIILTHRRCGYLLVSACLIYFIFNLVILVQGRVTALSGAISSTIVFGIFLYFIKLVNNDIKKEKT